MKVTTNEDGSYNIEAGGVVYDDVLAFSVEPAGEVSLLTITIPITSNSEHGGGATYMDGSPKDN